MGFDLSVRFADPAWYRRNRERVGAMVRALPSALDISPSDDEVWLKDRDSQDPWVYEARIFLKENDLSVEVMGFSQVFRRDIRGLLARLSEETSAVLVDDDGEAV
jgi:hypothetical protein